MSDFKFLPYWQPSAVKMTDKMFASFYLRAGKKEAWDMSGINDPVAVAIFCNESDFNGELRLKVDWQKLGLDDAAGLEAINAVHRVGLEFAEKRADADVQLCRKEEEYARVTDDGELVFPITEWNYRMIIIRQK